MRAPYRDYQENKSSNIVVIILVLSSFFMGAIITQYMDKDRYKNYIDSAYRRGYVDSIGTIYMETQKDGDYGFSWRESTNSIICLDTSIYTWEKVKK